MFGQPLWFVVMMTVVIIISVWLMVSANMPARLCRRHVWPMQKDREKQLDAQGKVVTYEAPDQSNPGKMKTYERYTGRWINTKKPDWTPYPYGAGFVRVCCVCGAVQHKTVLENGKILLITKLGDRVVERKTEVASAFA